MNDISIIKTGLAMWLSLLLAIVACPLAADVIAVEQQVQFADALYLRGLYDLALDEYLRISREQADFERLDQVLYRAGECHRRLGNPRAAERFFWRVWNEFPASEYRERAAFRRAEVLLTLGRDRDAYDLFQAFLELPPAHAELIAAATFYQAEAARKRGRPEDAERLYQEVLQQHANSPFAAYAALDLAALWRVDPERAGASLSLYEQVLANPPTPAAAAEALFQKADWHFGVMEYEQAAAAYERLRAEHPQSARTEESALQAGWSFYHTGRPAESLRLAEAALSSELPQRKKVEWLYLLANAQRQLLRAEEARETYQRLIDLDGPDGEWTRIATYELALMAFRRDDFEGVLDRMAAVEPDPELRLDLYWLLAESYAGVGRMDEAVQYYRLLLDAAPRGEHAPRALYRLAHILQTRRDFAEAARTYRRLAQEFPQDALAPEALMAAAFCATMLNRLDDALVDWQRLIDQFPQHAMVAEARYQSALVHMQADRHAQALAAFEALLEHHPQSPWVAEAHHWMGVIHQNQGDFDAAEKSLRAALAARPGDPVLRQVQYRLAVNLHQQGQIVEAADLLQELVPHQGGQMPSSLLEWLAVYRLEESEYAQVVTVADVLLRGADTAAWRQIGASLKGRGWQGQGDLDAAMAAFSSSVEQLARTRDGAEAALRMGQIHQQREEWTEANARFEQAAEWAQDEWLDIRAQSFYGLGQVAELSGDDRAAVRYYLAVGLFFDDENWVPSALQRAADALGRQGRTNEQQRTLAELAERYPDHGSQSQAQ